MRRNDIPVCKSWATRPELFGITYIDSLDDTAEGDGA